MKDGIEEMDRLCKEITGIKEARSMKMEDIIDSKYWEDKKKKNLIFGEDDEFDYWLASRGVRAYSDYASFGPGGVYDGYARSCGNFFYSNGYEDYDYAGLRPVVSLK